MSSEQTILNMLYRYCWLVDEGKFDEMAEMFDECDIYYGDYLAIHHDKAAFAQGFKDNNIVYPPDNSCRTIHMCIDPIIKVDEEAGTASAQHYTVVLQGIIGQIKPQIIVMDVKYDTFKRNEKGEWKFATRNMGTRCLGDMTHHQKTHGHHPESDPSLSLEATVYHKDFINP